LRLPLGLDLYQEDLAAEVQQLHFALYDAAGQLLACVSVVRSPGYEARIRQMAVQPELQGLGYGRSLLQKLERHLFAQGVTRLELQARVTAIGFYACLGYVSVGERYVEVGIPHQSMVKDLRA
jgi:predicted GNAT family N-acyltransferase